MAGKIKGITITLGADVQPLNKALADVNKKSKDLQSELRQVEKLLKFNPGNTELLAQKQKLLGDQVKATKEKLDTLRAAQAQVNEQFKKGEIGEEQYRAFQRELVKTESQLKHFESQLASTKKSLESYGKAMQDAGKKMTSAGKDLSMKVTAPLVGLGAVAIKTGMDFEAAMSEVGAISGATGADLQALEGKAKELGATTKFSASEAAEGLKYMAMAGWDTAQMMDGLPGILNLAAASGENLGAVSDIVTDAMTAFGMEAARAGEFADILAAASSNSNTNVGLLGQSFKYVAPVAGALGFEAKDTATALGLMANAGIKSSQAGSALRTVLTNLAKPTAQMQTAMDEYGISLTNADGSMKSLDEVMLNLRGSLGGLTEAEQAAAAATIFGKEAMSGALAIVNASESDYNKLSGAINNSAGAADRMAKEMQDNLKGRLVELKSAIEGVALQLYEAMQPALEKVVAAVQTFVDWLAKLSPGMQTAIIAIAGLAAAIGPILIVLGLLAQGVGAVIGVVGSLTAALPAFGAVLAALTGPIGLVVAAIAGLTAVWLIWGDDIKRITSDVVESVTSWFKSFGESIAAIWTAIKDFLEPFWTALKDFALMVFDLMLQGIETITTAIQTTITAIWTAIKDFLEPFWTALKDFALMVFDLMLQGIETITTAIQTTITAIWTAIKDFLEPFWTALKDFAIAIFTSLQQNIETITLAIQALITDIWNAIKDFLDETWNTISSTAESVFNAIKELLNTIMNTIKSNTEEAWNAIRSFLSETLDAIKVKFDKIWSGLNQSTTDAWEAMKSTVKASINGIIGFINDMIRAWNGISFTVPRVSVPFVGTFGGFSVGTIQIPEIPFLAKGGVVTKEMLAVLGEAGPEAVIPLPKLQPMLSAALTAALGKPGGGATIDYDKLAAAVAKHSKPSIDQINNFYSPKALTPSETAKQNLRVSRRLAMEWGL